MSDIFPFPLFASKESKRFGPALYMQWIKTKLLWSNDVMMIKN